jgi:PST family polysaccharide transporter
LKNSSSWFDTSHLKHDLKGRSVKGGANTFSAQALSFGLTLINTVVLARLLQPEDFGVVAMVTAITGFLLLFKDFGLSTAIIQKKEISEAQVNSVFWINTAIGLVLAILIAAAAPFIANFYDDDRLFMITVVSAIGAIFSGLSVQHNALINRQMMFGTLIFVKLIPAVANTVIAIGLAALGFGYWSIVIGNLSISITSFIVLWFTCDWRPSTPALSKGTKELLRFGMGISGFNFINYFSRNLDNILIGRYLGAAPLGLYTKAYQLLMLPITQFRDPLNAVGIPAMSTLQNEPKSYLNYYKQYLFILAFISMPVVVFLGLYSQEVILIVLGSKWVDASLVFQILAITAFIQPAAGSRGMVMISLGYSTRYFYWGLANAILVVLGFIVGIRYGLEGVAWSYAVVNYVLLVPSLLYSFKNTPIRLHDFFLVISLPVFLSLTLGVGVYILTTYLIEDLSNVVVLIIASVVYFPAYFFGFYVFPRGRAYIRNVRGIVTILIKKYTK